MSGAGKRGVKLIADFDKQGFAVDWFFAVPKSFRNALDIRLTNRAVAGKNIKRWTQGNRYSFQAGYILYSSPKGYEQWPPIEFKYLCQVTEAIPDETDEKGRKVDGWLRFDLFEPSGNHLKLEKTGSYRLTQSEFVKFLKTGRAKSCNLIL